ncbi:general transcription factor II-I repeat domain-containing protein 2B-like [Myzus persicae]|uniref:general transcription factor II-I repeat domain-containing protein 2B-like n=1 Tax=Myzus persicae TaxID=13164 RepID=UPI000B936102|nr:general transcription factor II-I repeat domain-containing protein 2B-like [Myzus persicae]
MKEQSSKAKYLKVDNILHNSVGSQISLEKGIDNEFKLSEKMTSLVPLKDTTKYRDLFEAVETTLNKLSLNLVNISGIATNGAHAMVGKKGLTKLVKYHTVLVGNKGYHCTVHQENVCAEALKMDNIMQIVIK